jgi:riboflavin biosynthesis pyrimidine reductase
MTWTLYSQRGSSVRRHRRNEKARRVITGHSKLSAGMSLAVRKCFIMVLRKTLLQDNTALNSRIPNLKNKASFFNIKRRQQSQDPKYITSLIVSSMIWPATLR